MSNPTAEIVRQEIVRELGRVQEDTYGETECNVSVALHETFVAVIMDLTLSVAEETLIESGHVTSVRIGRDTFQLATASTFMAIIERATGRRVTSFVSHAVIGEGREGEAWAMDIFRLGEKSPDGD